MLGCHLYRASTVLQHSFDRASRLLLQCLYSGCTVIMLTQSGRAPSSGFELSPVPEMRNILEHLQLQLQAEGGFSGVGEVG